MVDVRTSTAGRAIGCLLGVAVLLAPVLFIVGGSIWAMRASHSAGEAANELGLAQGPTHGFDGWYVGQWRGQDVALAATYRMGGAVVGQRSQPYLEVALRAEGTRVDGTARWAGADFEGAELPAALKRRATAFAREYGDLTVSGDPAAWPFGPGLIVAHEWPGDIADAAEVEARLEALSAVVSGP